MKTGLALLFGVTFAIFWASPVEHVTSDPFLSAPTAVSMVVERNLDLDEYVEGPRRVDDIADFILLHREDNGSAYNFFPWPVSVAAVPAVAGLEAAERVGVGDGATPSNFADVQRFTAAWVGALTVVVLALVAHVALGGLGRRRAVALAVGAAAALATPLWSLTTRALWLHGPGILLISLALLMALRIRSGDADLTWRRAAAMGAFAAGAYTIRPNNSILVAALGVWLLVEHRDAVPWFVMGGAIVGAAFLLVNVVEFGEIAPDYYGQSGRLEIHDAYWSAVGANLVSPARGLFTFSPILLLGVAGLALAWRRLGRPPVLESLLAATVVVQLFVVSAWFWWWAGHSFGPRFMSEAVPVMIVLAFPAVGALADRWSEGGVDARLVALSGLVGLALVWSAFVHGQGALAQHSSCWNTEPNIDTHRDRVWDWSDPQLLAAFVCPRDDDARGDP